MRRGRVGRSGGRALWLDLPVQSGYVAGTWPQENRDITSLGLFTRRATGTRGGGSGDAGCGGRRPATAPGGKVRKAKRKRKQGVRERILGGGFRQM